MISYKEEYNEKNRCFNLSSYSLVNFIQENFPDYKVEVIDYETIDDFLIKIKIILKSNSLLKLIGNFRMIKRFHHDLWKHLPLSKKRVVSDKANVLSMNFDGVYDAIVVGSDAIWNDIEKTSKLNYFLVDFKHCKKFSYAASTSGLDLNKLEDNSRRRCLKNALRDFSYIGVRESKAENFIHKVDDSLICYHNCDPTCFIKLDKINIDLKNRFLKYGIDDRPIVCLMTGNEQVGKHVYDEFHKTHQIMALYVYNSYADRVLYDISPMEFAVIFRYVDILFSYFFHGCYLCLKNATPVIAVDGYSEKNGEKTKIKDLFDRLGIGDWYFRTADMTEEDYKLMLKKAHTLINNSQSSFIESRLIEEEKYNRSFIDTMKKLMMPKGNE